MSNLNDGGPAFVGIKSMAPSDIAQVAAATNRHDGELRCDAFAREFRRLWREHRAERDRGGKA